MLKTKITVGLTSIILLSAVFATPAFADTDVVIAGNGSHSDNDVHVNQDRNTTVRQTNDTNITNDVSVSNNTGHNSASGNTGGDVSIRTGNATSDVNISNQAGANIANVNGCCDNGDTTLKIVGNGSRSDNSIDYSSSNNLTLIQHNDTDITNNVDVHNNTGENFADGNTWGDVSIDTGDADSNVNIHNMAGKNVANIDGCCGGGDTTIKIEGNGSKSDNSVRYNSDNDRNFYQNNDTDFDNNVDVHNNTGYNRASSDNYYPWWKDYDHGKKDYDYDHNKKDHDKKHYPFMKYDNHGKDYDHDYKDYDRDHDKKHHDSYKKDYDHDKNDHNRKDYGKNRHDGNKYSFVKYPYDNHQRTDYCDSGRDNKKHGYPWMNYHPYHGNTGGDVNIQTGDAYSDVNLHNLGSSNYLNFN